MKTFFPNVTDALMRASFGVRIHASVSFGEELMDEVARCLRRRLAVDLSMDKRVESEILSSPFLVNKLLLARKAGANIWVTSEIAPAMGVIFQADFGNVLVVSDLRIYPETRLIDAQDSDLQVFNDYLDLIGSTASEFIPDGTDIGLHVWAEKGDSGKFVVHWSTSNAESVMCDGLGELRLSGYTALTLKTDTILVIRAADQKQMRFKALLLKLDAELKVNYDIQFFNPVSASYYSLRDAGTSDVYGVVAGTKVRLSWNAGKAAEVEISPFGLSSLAGEHFFYPKDAGEIVIRAKSRKGMLTVRQGDELEYRIRIKEFPVPVFTQKFIIPDTSSVGRFDIRLNDFRKKTLHFLEGSGFLESKKDLAKEWRKKLTVDFERLKTRMKSLSFSEVYQSHSVPDLNRMVISRLKKLYPESWPKKSL